MQKAALVTGAARGIGLATAKRFLAEGWRVAIVDIDEPQLRIAAEELPEALAIEGDISDPRSVADFGEEIAEAFGRLDALVNNAGIADFGPLLETDFAKWRAVMATNLDGTFLVSQQMVPLLREDGGGAIVNIASISGLRGSTLRVAYGTSKAAVIQLTRQQAAELGEQGIRVNCVCPGPVRTKLAMAVHTPEIIAAYHDAIPLNRYGTEEELANAIWFLCSEQASYITGQNLAVDGGFEGTGIGLPALRVPMEEEG
jgi:NAD(P)-dependent dehydrogenase (short-subunit alcohol dehydrogenase family)